MRNKVYIVAVKSEKEAAVPRNWVDQIRKISGVEVSGGTRDQVTVLADEEAIRRLRHKLGTDFFIEEEMRRY